MITRALSAGERAVSRTLAALFFGRVLSHKNSPLTPWSGIPRLAFYAHGAHSLTCVRSTYLTWSV